MDETQIIVPAPKGDSYVALARLRQGSLFRKHILTLGELIHPSTKEKLNLDRAFADTLIKNFNDRVCDIVQVPLAGDQNEHVEAPDRNLGEVVGLELDGDKIFATIDIRKDGAAQQMGKTLLGASAFMHMNYVDTHTGEPAGPTLLHVAVTNRPYVTGLEDYQELVAASADNTGDTVLLTAAPTQESQMPQTLEDIKKELKEKHSIDLDVLQLSASDPKKDEKPSVDTAALVEALKSAGVVALSNDSDKVTSADVVKAVAELAADNVLLSNSAKTLMADVEALKTKNVESEIDSLVSGGFILPAKRDTMVKLALSNRVLFDELLPAEPLVALSAERGVSGSDADASVDDKAQAAIAKYTTGPDSLAHKGGYVR